MVTDALGPLARFGNAAHAATGGERDVFANWDRRASVRVKPAYRLGGGEFYFPPELVPVVSHPVVTALGEAVVRRLLVHRLYQYLRFTMELEAVTVLPVAARISVGRAGLPLPESMLADAFKIVTDEAWHGQFSYDLLRQVRADTGVPLCLPEVPGFLTRLRKLRGRVDADLRGVQDLLFATVSETLISSILSDLPKDTRLPDAVRLTVADHAQDEGRHHAYFARLLTQVWPALSRDQRRRVGPVVPELITAFLEPDLLAVRYALAESGVPDAELDRVIAESYPDGSVRAGVAAAARATVGYFAEAGALDDPGTGDAFLAAGLMPEV